LEKIISAKSFKDKRNMKKVKSGQKEGKGR
jgi:hypothetical protein